MPAKPSPSLAIWSKHLNHLSIHIELGLKDIRRPITPLLTYPTARSIGQAISEQRKQSGISVSALVTKR